MRKKIIFFIPLLLLLTFLFPLNTYASQAPPTYGVNPETKECSEFILGDECTSCVMPEGWEEIDEFECPDGFTEVPVEPICTSVKNSFCCTAGHSGSQGNCEDLVVNEVEQKCAFVEDINQCNELPDNWEVAQEREFLGKICPYDYTWLEEYIDCGLKVIEEEQETDTQEVEDPEIIRDVEDKEDGNTTLIYVLTSVILIETAVLIYLLLKQKKLRYNEE